MAASDHAEPEPLTEAQWAALRRARALARPLRGAARVARIDGAIMAVGAVLALIGGLGPVLALSPPHAPATLLGIVLGVAAWIERRAARQLLALHPEAPRRLALNQGLIALGIGGYAAWRLVNGLASRGEVGARLEARGLGQRELQELGIDAEAIAELMSVLTIVLYGGVILGTIIAQGLLAVYYLRRRAHIERAREGVPEWAATVVAELN